MAAQDPREPFDLVDEAGRPLGRTKARADVHRDGDWHRSLHLWVVLDEATGPRVVFQQRSDVKDTWPGAFDVAVTGHLRAGESLAEALREAEEEIGLAVAIDATVLLGRRRRAGAPRGDLRDNELQDVLATRTRGPLTCLRPHAEELAALVAVSLDDARAALAGDGAATMRCERLGHDGTTVASSLRVADLVPASDGYYERAIESLGVWLASGAAPAPWNLGEARS